MCAITSELFLTMFNNGTGNEFIAGYDTLIEFMGSGTFTKFMADLDRVHNLS